jgi:hypothetical protein
MAIPSRQIGWGTEENLLYEISKQLEILTRVVYNIPNNTTTTTTTINPNCINFVADTTLGGLNFGMTVESSADITYTATWGDGTTSDGTITNGSTVDIEHLYTAENTAHTVTLCFSDATSVTYLSFWGTD